MLRLLLLCLLPLGLSAQVFTEAAAAYGLASSGRCVGVAVGDYDGDEREDIYVGRSGMPSLLYRALPDGTFEEVTEAAGVSVTASIRMVLWADLDDDGRLDLLLGNSNGPNFYFHNDGDGTFSDRSAASGIGAVANKTRSLNVADIDGDGDLDLYTANVLEPNELFINDGTGVFTDECTLRNAQDELIAMGAIFFDYDLDGDQDLYVTHDSYQPNKLFENDGTGYFTERGQFSGTAVAIQSMGVDVGDMDNDGDFDIYVTNLGENVLLRNTGIGFFQNSSFVSGVTDNGMGWGTTWWDADNDSWQDLYVANEYLFAPVTNVLYRNKGDNSFENVSAGTALESPYSGYGMATLDVNYDGRLDLLQANNSTNDVNELFLNESDDDAHYLRLQLEQDSSNRYAVGARVRVHTDAHTLTEAVIIGSGYASQNSYRLHFGLATDSLVDVAVYWPSGDTTYYTNVAADSLYRIRPTGEPTGVYPLGAPPVATGVTGLSEAAFGIVQNPVSNRLRLSGPIHLLRSAIIFDVTGRPVHRSRLTSGEISVETLPPGVYVCRLAWPGGSHSLRFVKS